MCVCEWRCVCLLCEIVKNVFCEVCVWKGLKIKCVCQCRVCVLEKFVWVKSVCVYVYIMLKVCVCEKYGWKFCENWKVYV